MFYKIVNGDCLDVMKTMPAESVDSIVTDPPYGLKFMSKTWDHGIPGKEFWIEALHVAKPGAHLLAFGGTRTFHRLACAIEDAGWELRDCIGWVYGSGFPKSLDVSKAIDKMFGQEREVVGYDKSKASPNKENFAKRTDRQPTTGAVAGWKDNGATITAPATEEAKTWDGWGTALKPAWEPIIVARKPLIGIVAENVLRFGTGALNIDGCRIELNGEIVPINKLEKWSGFGQEKCPDYVATQNIKGRFPANLIHDNSEEVLACFPESKGQQGDLKGHDKNRKSPNGCFGEMAPALDHPARNDRGSAARFFYAAKTSKSERGEGNTHPTLKPLALMQYLVRLVTLKGGTVLDPFCGSGSTGVACMREGMDFFGIEKDKEYCAIAEKRLAPEGTRTEADLEEPAKC